MSGNEKVLAITHTHDLGDLNDFDNGVAATPSVSANTAHRNTLVGNPHNVLKSDVGLGLVLNIKHNVGGAAPPTLNDDTTQDYSVGSYWVVPSQSRAFMLTDATVGAAVWEEITPLAGTPLSDVFFAYDNVGNVNVTNAFTPIPWRTVVWNDTSRFTHVANSPDITVAGSEAVLLSVATDISTENVQSGSRSGTVVRLRLDTGSGFAEVLGSRAYPYNRADNAGRNSATVHWTLPVKPGYRLRVEAMRDYGGAQIATLPNACRIELRTVKVL